MRGPCAVWPSGSDAVATVTAEVRGAGASSPEASVSQQLMVEALPEIVIGPQGERIRTRTREGRQAVPKAGTPGIVPNIEFYDKTATSVRVRWGQPSNGGTKLTGFGLKFWKEGTEEPGYDPEDLDVVGPPPTPSEYTYTGMERGATYNFRIHACNGTDSCGYWTNPPKQVGLPKMPHSISVDNKTRTSARVKWSPEADTGGVALTGFGIRWRVKDTPWRYDQAVDVDDNARAYTMTGLMPNTTYEVIIQSCNGPGSCSPWNSLDNPYEFTTQEPEKIVDPPPGPVDRLWFTGFGGGTLDVEWTAADPGSTRPIVYKLEYRQNSSGTWTSVPDIPANTTQHTFSGLTDGTEYDVRVQACNDNTDDPCGDWVSPVCGVPGTTTVPGQAVLEAGDVTVAGSGEFRVTWDAPACVSAITLYEVQHKAETAASWSNPSNEIDSDTFTVEIGGLTVGTPYQVRVRACNTAITTTPSDFRDFQCGSWSDIQPGTPSGMPLPTPRNLDVVPLPQRMARVSWDAVADATGYVVEVKVFGETAWLDTACIKPPPDPPSHIVDQPNDGSDPKCDIDLDAITTDGGAKGLADNDAYTLQVTAMANAFAPSAPSRNIIIIDTPITVANGHSTSGTTAALTWTGIHDGSILGAGYAKGTYEVRYRVPTDNHARAAWRPNTFGAWITPDPSDKYEDITGTSITIDSLTSRQLYAIQLIKRDTGFTAARSVFAARDVYVWPSNDRAIAIHSDAPLHVGGMPLRYPMNTKTYEYRVCTETFPAGQEDKWVAYIKHAFDQWEFATNNLVSMTYNSGPCTDFSEIITKAVEIVRAAEADSLPFDIDRIAGDIRGAANMLGFAGLAWNDSTLNEIIMFDDVDMTGTDYYLWDMAIFPEIAPDIGHFWCWVKLEAIACAVPTEIEPRDKNVGFTSDIFIRREQVNHDPLILPGGDTVVDRDDIPFNRCPDNSVYGVMVHEVGHALGLRSGAGVPAGHPYEGGAGERPFGTVMLKQLERFSCSPHPLDVMSVYALYQSRP